MSPRLAGAGQGFDPDESMTVCMVDVDGSTLVVAATGRGKDARAANIAELYEVVDSLRFEP